MSPAEFCDIFHACPEVREWAVDNCATMDDAWANVRPDWLVWIATRPGVIDDRTIRLFAVWSARQVQHLMTDQRSLAALDVAERHACGQATDEELRAAWAAARDAARFAERNAAWGDALDDARLAREAARDAAWAAARAAARDALAVAWDAARLAADASARAAARDAARVAERDARAARGAARAAQSAWLRNATPNFGAKGVKR